MLCSHLVFWRQTGPKHHGTSTMLYSRHEVLFQICTYRHLFLQSRNKTTFTMTSLFRRVSFLLSKLPTIDGYLGFFFYLYKRLLKYRSDASCHSLSLLCCIQSSFLLITQQFWNRSVNTDFYLPFCSADGDWNRSLMLFSQERRCQTPMTIMLQKDEAAPGLYEVRLPQTEREVNMEGR